MEKGGKGSGGLVMGMRCEGERRGGRGVGMLGSMRCGGARVD